MGLFINLKSNKKQYSEAFKSSVNQQANSLILIVRESLQIANASPVLETKKARLEFAMKKVIDLIALANRYPFIDSKRISSTYTAIREVRNEIKAMESDVKSFDRREVA
ncbi:MAG: hypothetical protein IPH88_07825 [Bacteroidales bacterium]|nr:hypothetical protein [Bacteroidales bacterium]